MPHDLSKNNNDFLLKLPLDGLFFLVVNDNLNRRLKLKGNWQRTLPFFLRKVSTRALSGVFLFVCFCLY